MAPIPGNRLWLSLLLLALWQRRWDEMRQKEQEGQIFGAERGYDMC
jgi:hypothetical protein